MTVRTTPTACRSARMTDGGEGLNSRLSLRLQPGTYTLIASALGSSTGEYVLLVEEEVLDMRRLHRSRGDADSHVRGKRIPPLTRSHSPGAKTSPSRLNRLTTAGLIPRSPSPVSPATNSAGDDDGGEGNNALLTIEVEAGTYDIARVRLWLDARRIPPDGRPARGSRHGPDRRGRSAHGDAIRDWRGARL